LPTLFSALGSQGGKTAMSSLDRFVVGIFTVALVAAVFAWPIISIALGWPPDVFAALTVISVISGAVIFRR